MLWNRRRQPLSADVQTTKDSPRNPQARSRVVGRAAALLRSRLVSADYGIGKTADTFDADGDRVTILDRAHTGWRPGEDEIARQQGQTSRPTRDSMRLRYASFLRIHSDARPSSNSARSE